MKKLSTRLSLSLLAFSLLFGMSVRADIQFELINITESLLLDGAGQLPGGGTIYQPELIEDFYADNQYQPAWQDPVQVEQVLKLLAGSVEDGLNPDDYHYSDLMALWEIRDQLAEQRDRARARFDLLLTDGIVLYVRHLLEGKVDPKLLDPTFNYARRDFDPQRVANNLRTLIAEDRIVEVVEQARPAFPFYLQMKAALVYYRGLAQAGAFRPISADTVLKPGMTHSVVSSLRKRLEETGYLAPGESRSQTYDQQLAETVKQFQDDHGLDVDGVVGRQSYEFLNMSWAARVDSLRINMDRIRWVSQDISDDFIVVNIAGFELYYLRGGELIWETPVMTGTTEHQTPIFSERLKYLEFNPIWTVPRSIIARSLFPKFRANPQYVSDNNYILYDHKGRAVDPHKIKWSQFSAKSFPYRVVQQPGDKNALGRVKFIFPNRYAIYLHDTPSRALFSRSARAFSSGCVRVKNPLEFAEVLLNDSDTWSLAQVEALVDSREPQRRVFLDRDVDVMLMYWTTSPTRAGKLQFHRDIYGKDPAALAALDATQGVIGLATK
ncbi:MAG: L,D-transpeptidase family protein [Halioglobus sp.]